VRAGRTNVRDVRELLERLVAIESVNPTLVAGGAGEAEISRFVGMWLERHGLKVELQTLDAGRPNVIGRVRGSGGGRSLIMNGHLDTVGLGGADAGLTPRVEGARLFGRGAYDMKGSLAAIMLAAAEAATRGLRGDVIVTAVVDEEHASIGTEAVVETVRADAAIVAEPTELRLALVHKGFVWLEIETRGRAAHGSRPDLGVDAIVLMGRVLVRVGELDRSLRETELHPLLGSGSLHASLIEGGQELSTYPDRCAVKLERRTVPGETPERVEEELRELVRGLEASVKRLFARQPLATGAEEEIVDVLRESANRILDEPPEIVGVPFWTDAALLSAAGIPTIVFGPSGAGAHAETEWVDLEDVAKTSDILLATASTFCA
jgi:acetylornithine deacetylase